MTTNNAVQGQSSGRPVVGPISLSLWPIECDCAICSKLTPMGLSLPMYEGEVLPDDYQGEWAGMVVCSTCYAKHRPNPEHQRGAT